MYKCANCPPPPPVMYNLYTVNSDFHEHTTRQKHLLHINKGSTNQCVNIIASVWHALQL